jgi:hypothetical protein
VKAGRETKNIGRGRADAVKDCAQKMKLLSARVVALIFLTERYKIGCLQLG